MAGLDIRTVKKQLRSEFKSIRQNLTSEDKQRRDSQILEKITSLPEYSGACTILTYVSTAIEVDTFGLIGQALRDGKKVAVPRCTPGKIDMKFYFISSEKDLEPGAFGVLEPRPDPVREVRNYGDSVCILPGLSFDMQGYRLGYGKGYYDRFLSRYTGKNVGVCYNNCLRTLLPHGKYDKMVDILVTEKFIKRLPPPVTAAERPSRSSRKKA